MKYLHETPRAFNTKGKVMRSACISVLLLSTLFGTKVFGEDDPKPSSEPKRPDVTLVGSVYYASLCQYVSLWIDHLHDSLDINVIPVAVCELNSASPKAKEIINQGKRPAGNVAVLLENVWSLSTNYSSKVPKDSKIKISYGTFEGSKLPPKWVEIFNRDFDVVVISDPWFEEVYKKSGVKTPIFVLPAGLELDSYLDAPDIKEPHKPFTFGISGAYWDRKNHQVLMRAFIEEFGNSPDVQLKMHGRGGHDAIINSLRHIIKYRYLTNIQMLSYVMTLKEYQEYLKTLDCYVLPSHSEGYSISPRETMALGIPTIISNNTAHITLCNSTFVRPIECTIPVAADREPYGVDVGEIFDCSVTDLRKALRDVYENYSLYLEKAKKGREWVKQYRFQSLKPLFLALIKPEKVVLGKENKLEPGILTTDSEELYNKYLSLNQTKDNK